jgi:hypothetical protein
MIWHWNSWPPALRGCQRPGVARSSSSPPPRQCPVCHPGLLRPQPVPTGVKVNESDARPFGYDLTTDTASGAAASLQESRQDPAAALTRILVMMQSEYRAPIFAAFAEVVG